MPSESEKPTPDTFPSPLQRIGPVAVEAADSVLETFGDAAQVLNVCIVLEVAVTEGDLRGLNSITYHCSDPRRWVQRAFLQEAADRAQSLVEELQEETADALDAQEPDQDES